MTAEALFMHSWYSCSGMLSATIPAPDLTNTFPFFFVGQPDSDADIQISTEINIPDSAAVKPAPVSFKLADQLAGTELRRS